MSLFGDEKSELLEKCTVSQLKEIAKTKKIVVGPGYFSTSPRKQDYIDELYGTVSVAYLKRFLSDPGAVGGRVAVGGKRIPRSRVIAELGKFHVTGTRKNEREYERDLLNWARGRFGRANVTTQYSLGRTRIDMVIGGVGVELKVPRNAKQLQNLRGQAEVYQKHFGKDLVLLLFRPECDPSIVAEFKQDLKKKGVAVLEKG